MRAPDPTVTSEPTDLFQVAPTREPSNANWCPPEPDHRAAETPVEASPPVPLWQLQDIQHGVRADPLNAVVADLTVQSA
jgi:hypothetical protein